MSSTNVMSLRSATHSSNSLTTRPCSLVAVHASQAMCSMLGSCENAPLSVVLNSRSNAIAVFSDIATVYASPSGGSTDSRIFEPNMGLARCFSNSAVYRPGYANA